MLASVNLVAVLAVRQLPETSGSTLTQLERVSREAIGRTYQLSRRFAGSAMGRKLSGECLDRLGGGAGQQSGLAHRRTSDEEDSGWTEEEGRGHGVQLLLSPSRPGVGQRPQR